MPSLASALATARRQAAAEAPSRGSDEVGPADNQVHTKLHDSALGHLRVEQAFYGIAEKFSRLQPSEHVRIVQEARVKQPSAPSVVDVGSTVYMLNPSGDLATTQAEFADTFRQQPGWQVA